MQNASVIASAMPAGRQEAKQSFIMTTSIKVLLADDEPSVLEIMAKKVAQAGFTVSTATDGIKAWAAIVRDNPDVIVLDLTMPGMDGWEVLEKLRKTPPSSKWQPVIIVSALNEIANVRKGLDMEADHYLTKPCRIEDILKAIRLMAGLIPQRNR